MRFPVPLLLAMLVLAAVPARAADETDAALEALCSPAERIRADGVERLVDLLPASRRRVIAALEGASPDVRLHLVEVLGRDGSPEAIQALLRVLENADDLLASRIELLLARDRDATRAILAAWKASPETLGGADGKPPRRMEQLAHLLRRSAAEEIFLSRKSKTGGTGSYHGQFAVLELYRDEAIELCVDILLDRAPALPGIVRAGKFDFLRPDVAAWDIDEIQSMAANAFGELGRPTDFHALISLTGLLKRLNVGINRLGVDRWPDEMQVRRLMGRYSELLIGLYRVNPQQYGALVDPHLRRIENWRGRGYLDPGSAAAFLLRVGRYREAIDAYGAVLDPDDYGPPPYSYAMTYYNLACAYAQWGLELEGDPRKEAYSTALDCLRRSVEHHWSDVGWLDEDRDLDPIRDRPGFKELREEMIRAITPPDDD